MKKYLVITIKVVLAVFIVWYLLKSGRITKEVFAKLFRLDNIPYLLLSGIAFYAAQALAALRFTLIVRMIDLQVSFVQVLKLTLIGNFFNMVLPGSVGGDVIKGFFLIKSEGEGRGRSSGIVIMDRVIGLFALLLIAAAAIFYLARQNKTMTASYHKEILTIFAVAVVLSLVFLAVLLWGKNKALRSRLKEFTRTLFRNSVIYYIIEGLAVITRKRRVLLAALFLSLMIQVLSLLGVLILVKMTAPVSFSFALSLMAVSSVVMLMSVIPVTPGNIGWTELMASLGWAAVGSKAGGEIFFYWRIICILFSLPGAIFYYVPGLTGLKQEVIGDRS